MPIDITELKRLHEAAQRGGPLTERMVVECPNSAALFAVYSSLIGNFPEIVSALEDRARLEWMAKTGYWITEAPSVPPYHWEVRDLDNIVLGKGETFRAAIDAAIKEHERRDDLHGQLFDKVESPRYETTTDL